MQIGDLIYILQGNQSPVILRKIGDYHIIVGPCYIVGLMHGEAAELARSGRGQVEMLLLC